MGKMILLLISKFIFVSSLSRRDLYHMMSFPARSVPKKIYVIRTVWTIIVARFSVSEIPTANEN